MSIVHLLDEIGPWYDRLKSVHRMIKAPDFLYAESPMAMYLSALLVNSSYWLDTELFNESVIQKALTDKTITGEQKLHALLLDIGSTLIDKGFPLKQEMVDTFCPKTSPVYSYTKTFLIQCYKRNDWLKGAKIVSHKNISPVAILKENIH